MLPKKISKTQRSKTSREEKDKITITTQKTMNKIAIIILLPQLITLKVNRYSPIKRHREAEWNKKRSNYMLAISVSL